jgi:hypothetical protein
MNIILCLPNRPNQKMYLNKRILKNLKVGEVKFIINECGNHWRKIFSIFAKICFSLNPVTESWQEYRDNILLTSKCIGSISFTKKILKPSNDIMILSGKESWTISKENSLNIFNTPYFDYRQFPNKEIDLLISQIKKNNL